MKTLKRMIQGISLVLLSGCSFVLGSPEDKSMYVLSLPACSSQGSPLVHDSLLVRNTQASKFIDSQKIIFSDDPLTRGFYQFATWTESPARQISKLLFDRLQCEDIFEKVTRGLEPSITNYSLSTEILDFRHDASQSPGTVIVEIRAELYDLVQRNLIAGKTFHRDVPLSNTGAIEAVKAFNTGTIEVISDISGWMKEVIRNNTSSTK